MIGKSIGSSHQHCTIRRQNTFVIKLIGSFTNLRCSSCHLRIFIIVIPVLIEILIPLRAIQASIGFCTIIILTAIFITIINICIDIHFSCIIKCIPTAINLICFTRYQFSIFNIIILPSSLNPTILCNLRQATTCICHIDIDSIRTNVRNYHIAKIIKIILYTRNLINSTAIFLSVSTIITPMTTIIVPSINTNCAAFICIQSFCVKFSIVIKTIPFPSNLCRTVL